MTAPLIVPLLLVLLFENVWLTGMLNPVSCSRAGGAISILVLAFVGLQLAAIGADGLFVALFAAQSFTGVLAVTAIIHPMAEDFWILG